MTAKTEIERLQEQLVKVTAERDAAMRQLETARKLMNIKPVLLGHFRHNQEFLCCGTIRIARDDFDTQPSESFKKQFWDWVCDSMNLVIKLQKD